MNQTVLFISFNLVNLTLKTSNFKTSANFIFNIRWAIKGSSVKQQIKHKYDNMLTDIIEIKNNP